MPCRRAWGRCRIQFRPRYGTPARLTGRVHEGDGQHCLDAAVSSSSRLRGMARRLLEFAILVWTIPAQFVPRRRFRISEGFDQGTQVPI